MPRPKKTLRERVLANSFRADRYAHLLASEPLSPTPPFGAERRRGYWQALCQLQDGYRRECDLRELYAADFARVVRSLHGAPAPSWFGDHLRGRSSGFPCRRTSTTPQARTPV